MLPNTLSAQHERLHLLIEECGEVIQAATKILRHGYQSSNPELENPPTNRDHLEQELGHLQNAINFLSGAGDISPTSIVQHSRAKAKKIYKYLHFQGFPPL